MSKRNSANSFLSFDVLKDINDWIAEENGENDEIGDNRNELCVEEEEIDSNLSEWCLTLQRLVSTKRSYIHTVCVNFYWTPGTKQLKEEQQSEELEDNVNWQQRYGPGKQLTRNRNFITKKSYI